MAEREGVSLNQYAATTLARAVGRREKEYACAESKGSLKESTIAQVRFTPLQPELEEGKGVGGRPQSR